jgi:H+/Cl- antiporter ClcA
VSDVAAQTEAQPEGQAQSLDPVSIMRQKGYRRLLVLAGIVGLVVSITSWAFLELVHYLQVWVFDDLPDALGFASMPTWWPLPVLAIAGLFVALAVNQLPGRGGHEPSEGLAAGSPTQPNAVPGVVLAALATLGLGLVLGPEAPLIALGSGLGVLAMRRAQRGAPDQTVAVMAAAGSFAAIASIFGSPVIGALIIIEAAGLGGPMMPLILLPGLIAAGIGSLVFVGIGSQTGLSTQAYAIVPLSLPDYPHPTFSAFLWTIALAVVVAVATYCFVELGKAARRVAEKRPFFVVPAGGLVVAALAIAFFEITDQPSQMVLFSGQEAMDGLVKDAATLSLGTIALLIVFKGLAWSVSLGVARGGPTFPAMFLGIAAGLLAAHLPGFSETPAVAVLMGAACVSVLRLPLSSIVLALIVSACGLGATPLVIVGVVAAYLVTIGLAARRASRDAAAEPAGARPTSG